MSPQRVATLVVATAATLSTGCAASTTPLTGSPPLHSIAQAGSREAVFGEVVAVRGVTVTALAANREDVHFDVADETRVTRIVAVDSTQLTPGSCALAGGRRDERGTVIAVWVLLEAPAGCTPAGSGLEHGSEGLFLANGVIRAVSGSVYSVEGPDGQQRFAVTGRTPVALVVEATVADLTPGRCAVARGLGERAGPLVAASVALVPSPGDGCFKDNNGIGALSFLDPHASIGMATPPPSRAPTRYCDPRCHDGPMPSL